MRRIPRRIVFGVACAVSLAGCDEASRRVGDQPDEILTQGKGVDRATWIQPADRIDPALWLAGKERRQPVSPSDPAVENLHRALAGANEHFLESSRMLTNRTAQLGAMLAADDRPEDYAGLLGALSLVASGAGKKQTYGELCQHYFNLRHDGMERNAAIATLSERYSAQRR